MEAEIGTSVRGCDVFLFAGGGRNEAGLSAEENKVETYHAVDALRRAQAQRITVFEPYCGPGRSDRLTRRNSVGLWLHFKILISLGHRSLHHVPASLGEVQDIHRSGALRGG